MDVLGDVLNGLELRGWLSSRSELTRVWRFEYGASEDMIFHILKSGSGYLRVGDEGESGEAELRKVGDGDVMLFPHGDAHMLCDDVKSPLTQAVCLSYEKYSEQRLFPCEGEGEKMVLLCGAFRFEENAYVPLVRCLPRVIHIAGEQGRMVAGFGDIVSLIAQESVSERPGSGVMLRRLTEMLFIQVVRVWIEQQVEEGSGWLAALKDDVVSTALGLIHRYPERGWRVEELAEEVALSRSAFSARFTRLVGEPPLKYVTRWRMHKAMLMLKKDVRMEVIAEQLGYDSDVAFRKAFKREVGVPPAAYRRGV